MLLQLKQNDEKPSYINLTQPDSDILKSKNSNAMAIDWLIIVTIVIVFLILVGLSFYILVVYVHCK